MHKQAVILAGGKGERLGPYTTVLPKPLLPIGDRAILDVVVRQLRSCGFSDLTFAVGYLAHLIEAVFADGSDRGVRIEYHHEDRPRGTAGPLATVGGLDESFLVMNGDVLTTLDYDQFYRAHKESGNALTIATHRRVVKTEYGVLHTVAGSQEGTNRVTAYEEKPEIPYVVSIGVYMMEPEVLALIPPDTHFDIPDVVQALLERDMPVGSYLYDGFWLDIGRHEDYERAINEWDVLSPTLLRETEPEQPLPAPPSAESLAARS